MISSGAFGRRFPFGAAKLPASLDPGADFSDTWDQQFQPGVQMSFFKKLLGGGKEHGGPRFDPVDHNGFTIYPDPIPEGGVFRVAARIEKLVDGETRSQGLVRADTANSIEIAADIAITFINRRRLAAIYY